MQYFYKVLKLRGYYILLIYTKSGVYNLQISKKKISSINRKNFIYKETFDFELENKLRKYFLGEKVEFNNLKIDFSGYSLFAKNVLKEVCKTRYGKIITYKELSKRCENPKSYRAVGQVLSSNRTPILIPCHRVVKSDGTLGGFSCGVELKKELLDLECIS